MQEKDQLDLITGRIIGAAVEVHKGLGPGLLESAYERAVNEFPDSAFSATSAVKKIL